MLRRINKKILVYISFFFILFSTLNNNNFLKVKFIGINQINIYGLNEMRILKLEGKIRYFKRYKFIFLDKIQIQKHLDSFNIIENYSIFKKYPASLEIKINKTNYLANVHQKEKIFFLVLMEN